MSKTPTVPAPAPPQTPPKKLTEQGRIAALLAYMLHGKRRPDQITIISHSDLFYWWPVWVVGFVMAAVTGMHGVHAGFVAGEPKIVTVEGKIVSSADGGKEEDPNKLETKTFKAIVSDNKTDPFPTTYHGGEHKHTWPIVHNNKQLGDIFMIVLLLVIIITNVHLRGLWSLIIIIVLVLGSIILALSGYMGTVVMQSSLLAIHLNMGAYLFLSIILFVLWVIFFIFFDRQRYVIVEAGQVRLRLAIGEGEIAYDAVGMVFQKQRSDLFRHWILGFGSGDLIIRPAGGKDPIDLPNVLFVGGKVREVTSLLKEKIIVAG